MVWGDQRRVPAALSAAVTMGITTAWPNAAAAHATGQSFVALLPTGPYMAVGVATVALSIMLLWLTVQRRALPYSESRIQSCGDRSSGANMDATNSVLYGARAR